MSGGFWGLMINVMTWVLPRQWGLFVTGGLTCHVLRKGCKRSAEDMMQAAQETAVQRVNDANTFAKDAISDAKRRRMEGRDI